MKKLFHYYVVDSLTESIVGDFNALNSDVAKKILNESFKNNDKLKLSKDSLKLVYIPVPIDVPETYDEVMECSIASDWIPFEVVV